MSRNPHALVDLSALQVGDHLPELALAPIGRTTLALFAGGSGDHNPIHLDPDAARAGGLDDVIAHGMLSMAYLGRLLTDWAPQEHLISLSSRFAAMTPLGAAPRCTGTVTNVDDEAGKRLVHLELAVILPDGTVTLRGQAVLAVPDRSRDQP